MLQEEFEKKVMELTLEGDGPYLELFREQYRNATIRGRDMTGVGFYTGFLVDEKYASENRTLRGYIKGPVALYSNPKSGMGAMMLILWVEQGLIKTLEGIQMDGYMPEREFLDVKFEKSIDKLWQKRFELRE